MTNPPKCPACYNFELRRQGLPELPDERAAIVKLLRSEAGRWTDLPGAVLAEVANAIEKGEHLK